MIERKFDLNKRTEYLGRLREILGIVEKEKAGEIYYLISSEDLDPGRNFCYLGKEDYPEWKEKGYQISWSRLAIGNMYTWITQKELISTPLDDILNSIRKEIGI